MKRKLFRFSGRIVAVSLLLSGLGILLIFNPSLTYAAHSTISGFSVYHQSQIPSEAEKILSEAHAIVQGSDLYSEEWKLDICLKDGSVYPEFIQKLKGKAFGYGYYNKVVLGTEVDWTQNHAEINGVRWNLTELLAHEMVHCYQYYHYGLKTLKMPVWILEGYAEYVSRKPSQQGDFLALLDWADAHTGENWLPMKDGTSMSGMYLQHRLLVQYMLEIEGKSFDDLVKTQPHPAQVRAAMIAWREAWN